MPKDKPSHMYLIEVQFPFLLDTSEGAGYLSFLSHFDFYLEWHVNRLVSNCARTKEQRVHFVLFKTNENANYSPEPRLCSFVPAQFETSLLTDTLWRKRGLSGKDNLTSGIHSLLV